MSSTVGIRFTLDAGNVDFYKEEIEDISFMPAQAQEQQSPSQGLPYIYAQGDVYNSIEIEFIEEYSTTKAKIDQLIDEDDEMTLYYQYAFDSSEAKTVILAPDERIKTYTYGELLKMTHKLTFWEV